MHLGVGSWQCEERGRVVNDLDDHADHRRGRLQATEIGQEMQPDDDGRKAGNFIWNARIWSHNQFLLKTGEKCIIINLYTVSRRF